MNRELPAITLTAAAAAGNSDDMPNVDGRGVRVFAKVTTVGGTDTPSVTFTIEGKDPVSGSYYTLLAGAAIVAAGVATYTVYPGLTPANNVTASNVVPAVFRVKWAIAGTTPAITATVGVCTIV